MKKGKTEMITVSPCAKINLGLNITERRQDGYHNLETIFYPIPLYDKISIEAAEGTGTCNLETDGITIAGAASDNLAAKAYKRLCKERTLPSVNIRLSKQIPTQAGMGGGSADCAFTITALNNLFDLHLSVGEMQSIAAELGADCAFFISPRPCYATGIGERLYPVNLSLKGLWLLIIKPDVCVSTKEAFSMINPHKPERNCKDIVTSEPIAKWRYILQNDFEYSIFAIHPELNEIKTFMYNSGALYAAMSGSGSSLFGIFDEEPDNNLFMDKFGNRIFIRSMRL